MHTFTLSSTLNKKRVFILRKSEMEKRFDPAYYSHEFNEYDKKLSKKPFKKFRELIKSLTNGYDFRDYKNNGTPYLKVANIKQGEFDFSKLQYIDFNSSEISKKIQLKKGNILLTRKGTFGNTVALDKDYDYVISSEVFYIELKEGINPRFLEIFFNSRIGQLQFDKNKIGAIMGSLSQEAVKELKIPLLKNDTQNKIIAIYDKYIEQKKQNEAQADKLLASIDQYLLAELGIKLPSLPENSLKDRIFKISSNKLVEKRIDPNFHKAEYSNIINAIKLVKHLPLSKLVNFSNETWDQKSIFSNIFPYIEISEIDTVTGAINLISEIEINDAPSRAKMIVRNEDILVSTTRPNRGAIALYKNSNNEISIASTGFAIVRKKSHLELDNEYLWFALKSEISLKQMEQRSSGGNYPAITQEELGNILIPFPKIEKQKEIAKHINAIRESARKLREKSNEALASASEEIEAILLG